MALVLYGIPVSTYCQKVRLVLKLKGVAFADKAPPGGYGSPEYKAIVPSGTVPALDHDGFVLAESDAIVEYLDEAFPMPRLHPADLKARARHRALMRHHDTRFEPAIRAMFPAVAPGPQREHLPRLAREYEAALQKLAGFLAAENPAPFLGGRAPALADCPFPTSLMMGARILEFFGLAPAEPPALSAWRQALEGEPLIAGVVAECRAALDAWLETRSGALPHKAER